MKKGSLIFSFVFILSIFGAFFISDSAIAQVQSTDVVLSIVPKYPVPGDKVTATLTSYVTNLDKANMTWSVNGQNMVSGVGKKVFTFTLGTLGSTTLLNVDVQTIDRQSFSKNISLNATEIDMLWEATDSYVPPFYKGKALLSREGSLKVVAIPNIVSGKNTLNPTNLSYIWEKDGKGQPNSSGWGMNFFIFKNSYIDKSNEVIVKVSDIFGNNETGNNITITPGNPKIQFYKKDILQGIDLAHILLDGHLVDKKGETVVAVPYFFSPKNINSPDLLLTWLINDKPARISNIKNELGIKGEEGKSGQAKVKVNIKNPNTLFQSLEKEINVVF
ncbi:MAG: hypothetical protein M3Q34_01340 [bacterium]|nr:hypothetical protein [bacterium]